MGVSWAERYLHKGILTELESTFDPSEWDVYFRGTKREGGKTWVEIVVSNNPLIEETGLFEEPQAHFYIGAEQVKQASDYAQEVLSAKFRSIREASSPKTFWGKSDYGWYARITLHFWGIVK